MNRILLYILIIMFGFSLSKYDLISKKIKTSLFQTLSLLFLLAVMGYKIGSNNKIISEFPKLGFQAFTIAILSVIGSIIVTMICFTKKKGDKK